MKLLTYQLLMVLLAGVCASAQSQQSSLEALRQALQPKLPDAWACDAVTEFDGTQFFNVRREGSPRFQVSVTARQFLTQAEWDARYSRALAAVKLMTTSTASANEASRAMNDLMAGTALPNGTYGEIGVSVNAEDPEYTYPEVKRDGVEANQIVIEVKRLLKLYREPAIPLEPAIVPLSTDSPP